MANKNKNLVKDEDQKVTPNTRRGGRRSSSRRKGSSKPKSIEQMPSKGSNELYNDPSYYFGSLVTDMDQVTRMSFQSFLGGTPIGTYAEPTIMTIMMNPCPGVTYFGASPALNHPTRSGLNMSATKIFNMLSMKSGRNMAYAPQDVGTMLLGISALCEVDSYCRRAFGTVGTYNPRNRMYPKACIEAMGLDFDDFTANLSDYRSRYNALINSVNQLPILSQIGYLRKSRTMYDKIFTDSESSMAQSYIYVPYSTWVIDETSFQGGTILKTIPFIGDLSTEKVQKRTMSWILTQVMRPMVDALLTSSTLNLVYADLLNLAKYTNLEFYQFEPIMDGYAVFPEHNYEALLHIHNMKKVGIPNLPTNASYSTESNNVYPNPSENSLAYNPGFSKARLGLNNNYVIDGYVIDSPKVDPDLTERVEITRYLAGFTNNTVTYGGADYLTYAILPDHYVVSFVIFQNSTDVADQIADFRTDYIYGQLTANETYATQLAEHFDWHPICCGYDTAVQLNNFKWIIGDLNYYTTLPALFVERLNETIYLGLFDFQVNYKS